MFNMQIIFAPYDDPAALIAEEQEDVFLMQMPSHIKK
jgi:hypothetical protein